MKLERYRKTMTHEVLQSWAEDAQKKIDELEGRLKDAGSEVMEIQACLRPTVEQSKAALEVANRCRDFLKR